MIIGGYCDERFISVKHAFEKKLSIGYAMNKMYMKGEDPRTGKLVKAVWDVINKD